ncbi:SDR family NAD(P)-dependent oxidoreductase [Phenylobacterium sp.]|uniref:SDR family NAD(P)-dependent oxidoreductase n=1 Tax=Phenylobacterium sp. TaxID=1871053 RepID=UPI002F3E48B7
MELDLKGRVVAIAGASRGIGLGIAETCLAEGAKVAISARNPEALEATRLRLAERYGEDCVWARAGDMRETNEIEACLNGAEAELGPLWGAVANVGIYPCPPGIEVDDETWDAGFRQNLDAAYRLARSALRRLVPRGEGSVLLISSIAGIDAMGSSLTYGVAKAAVNHLGQELARLAGPANVRVNAIAPGNIVFQGGTWAERLSGPRGDVWRRWVDREVPLKRFGAPEEIGSVAAFMLSPRASFMTGMVAAVDGGQTR